MKTLLHVLILGILLSQQGFKAQIRQSSKAEQLLQPKWLCSGSENSQRKNQMLTRPGIIENFYWDISSNNWYFSDSAIYSYNSNGMPLSVTNRNGNPISRHFVTYDSQDRMISQITQFYSFSNWKDNSKTEYVYDAQGNISLESIYNFDTQNNQWELVYGYKYLNIYNSINKLTGQELHSWDDINLVWEPLYKMSYQYDGTGNVIQQDYMDYSNNGWNNQERYKFTYSLNNEPVEIIFQEWSNTAYVNAFRYTSIEWKSWCGFFCNENKWAKVTLQEWSQPIFNSWNNYAKASFVYDNYGGWVETLQMMSGSSWVNDFKYTVLFDTHSNYSGERQEYWNSTNSSWNLLDEEKVLHTYNASQNLKQSIYQYWDGFNGMVNQAKYVYSDYRVFTGIFEVKKDQPKCRVYPNPCSQYFMVSVEQQGSINNEPFQFRLYDILGNEVLQRELPGNELRFEVSEFPRGMYLYTLTGSTGSFGSGKLLLN